MQTRERAHCARSVFPFIKKKKNQESSKYHRFVVYEKVFQFKVLYFGLFTAPQFFSRVMAPVSAILHSLGIRILRYLDDWLILASSRVEAIRARDSLKSLPGTRHCHQFRQISPLSISDIHLPENGDRELDFEGFLFSGEGTETSVADRRISVLQAAKRRLLDEPVWPSVLSLSASPRRSSPNEIPPAYSAGRLGFSRRVGLSCLDTLERPRSVLVVRHPESSRQVIPGAPPSGPAVFVRRL